MYICTVFEIINMKKLLAFVVFVMVALSFTTCNKVEEPFYVIPTVEDVTVNFPDLDPGKVYRKILIEEFTGHQCQNCPVGHRTLEELHNLYGDTIVAVGIHYGSLADVDTTVFTYDFRTVAGNLVGQAYLIDGIPAAIFNRNYKEGGWFRNKWMAKVSEIDRSIIPAAIQLINEYDEANKTVKANVKVTMLQEYSGALRLGIYLVEDGIVKPQIDGNQTILEYVHNHVLRGAFTDPFGAILDNGKDSWSAGDTELYAATLDFQGKDWDMNNCYVVAFLVDPTNSDVLQVEKLDVISR